MRVHVSYKCHVGSAVVHLRGVELRLVLVTNMAATSLTESAASFKKQAAALGLHEDWITGLEGQRITTFGRLAFACDRCRG